jgi:hypothetical protein
MPGLFYARKKMSKFYYGVTSIPEVKVLARRVRDALGGSDAVLSQMIETTCAETKCGMFPDSHPDKWGVGLCQHDQIALDDIQLNGEQRHFDIVQNVFGYDIKTVELEDLAYDPLLSLICCRLSYKRIPESIPNDLNGRAKYWKEYYNTKAGDGTVEHYLESVEECLGKEWG